MRHSLTKLLAASSSDSPTRSESPAPAATCLLPPDLTRAAAAAAAAAAEEEETAAAGSPGRKQPRGDEGELEAGRGGRGGVAVRAPSPEEMEEEAIASVPGEETEDMDFLSGLELADLLDPRQPDWHLEPGLSSPGPLSSSGGGSDSGGLWRGDDDDEAAAAEMQRFSELLQRLLNGIGGCSSGSDSGSGEKRRRKSPGGGGGGSGNDNNQAATKSPRKAAAAAARLNRLKKKEYVMGLESRVRGLAAENQELRAENRELGKRVQALQEESRYLRAVLANETGLARLLSRLSGVGLRLTTSLFRDSPAGDHDYALPVGKQQQDLLEEDDSAGGVCLHVDKDKVSVEFCSACARKASSSLKIFFFR
ncbi:CREB/ATF bZIP transcription factor isoform X1 [Callorhinus ursinus]|uniref:CREB/ATF bZIP transcription factor n=1 Tax=Callorhinus ursinus TaxID=34884 RepID=A0A3Q7QU36_CALUR|nr:CREB/ATF bZIP transcription factor isoform X1 [Callorhinus ursinus]XP_025750137.1 CREB/ATF bZIP transcription factor isoform X1 [Callorhinus ursinus]XP_025750138.1 CREB/ATF bZIP transcription factor isoform X1 [Callorhinus ursinus]XP_025750139.1 CREB/ATF bZIP transcription factor isoform X1 [Callorhinus ursinus]XP_025750140.1 CREB/ATF bZIP transcription factor isoform X1 [Callorhinus ursinus]XP_025750141.1 CREB/ATF bZIP transcription factor isoform X1 [Callorhinus ursinus]XP_025750142.1 CR